MLGKSFAACLITASLLSIQASAFWRLPCPQTLFVGRSDPIDTPGKIAHHVHTIHGGNKFHKSCTNEELKSSSCSSCMVKQDKSAYWTPNMYFKRKRDGKYFALRTKGGILVYYLQRGQDVQPFPDGFRVIAGDSRQRNFTWPAVDKTHYRKMGLDRNQDFLRQKSSGFNCLNYDLPANPTLGNNPLPQDWKKCKDGIRGEVNLPSCWNGKDVDSEDHHSHMAYPSVADDGDCPPTHPIRLVTILIEVIFDPLPFLDEEGDLVLSNGDLTGYSWHADFQNGWDTDVLRRAINECRDDSGLVEKCKVFDLYTSEETAQCTLPNEFPEEIWGPLEKLPGCNPVTIGSAYAPKGGSTCADEHEDTPATVPTVPIPPKLVKPVQSIALKPVETPSSSPVYAPAPPSAPQPAQNKPSSKLITDSYIPAPLHTQDKSQVKPTEISAGSPECEDFKVEGPKEGEAKRSIETHKDEHGNDVQVVVLTVTVTHYSYAPAPTPGFQS